MCFQCQFPTAIFYHIPTITILEIFWIDLSSIFRAFSSNSAYFFGWLHRSGQPEFWNNMPKRLSIGFRFGNWYDHSTVFILNLLIYSVTIFAVYLRSRSFRKILSCCPSGLAIDSANNTHSLWFQQLYDFFSKKVLKIIEAPPGEVQWPWRLSSIDKSLQNILHTIFSMTLVLIRYNCGMHEHIEEYATETDMLCAFSDTERKKSCNQALLN